MKKSKKINKNEISERLNYIISKKVSSKKDFAKILNIAPTTVSGWTTGRIMPSIYVLIKIAILTHTSLDWLLLGKTTNINEVLDEQIFDQVFNEGYSLAKKYNLTMNGSYFLGLYSLVFKELEKNPLQTPKEIITNNQKIIIQLKK